MRNLGWRLTRRSRPLSDLFFNSGQLFSAGLVSFKAHWFTPERNLVSATVLLSSEVKANTLGSFWIVTSALLGVLFLLLLLTDMTPSSLEFLKKFLKITGRLVLRRMLGVLSVAL